MDVMEEGEEPTCYDFCPLCKIHVLRALRVLTPKARATVPVARLRG